MNTNEVGASIPARLETVGGAGSVCAAMMPARMSLSVGEYQTFAGVWG